MNPCNGRGELARKVRRFGFVTAAVVFIASPAAGFAAEAAVKTAEPSPLTLGAVLESALAKNPEVAAAKAEALAGKKEAWIRSALPDPMVEIAPGTEESQIAASQEIPFPAKLWEKGKIGAAEGRAASFRYLALRRDLLRRAASAYYDLYYADASRAVLEDMKELLKGIERVAESRYSSLSGTSRDVAKAQAEVSLILERLYRLEQERESAAAMLNAILDNDPMTALGPASAPPKPEVGEPLVDFVNLAVKNREEIKEAEAIAEKSRHAKRLAGLAYFPDLKVGFEYDKRPEEKDNWMIPIGITVPVWQNRVIPEIQQAGRLAEAGEARIRQARNQSFFEVKDAYHRYEAASKIRDLYEAAVIPQAQIALNADRAGYESGSADFLNLLDSERVYLNAKLSYIQFFTDALKAHADLLRAAGLDLPEVSKEERHENKD